MSDIAFFIVELIVLLICVYLGARVGGLGIGFYGGVGVAVYGFGFQRVPGEIPFDVIQIIMAVICAIAAMQAAGGMDYLVSVAGKALRKAPRAITFVAPLITFLMTILAGTGHTAYSTLPVIAEVAKESGVRPSRPLSVAVVASQVAICASPIAAAVVWFADEMEPRGTSYMKLLAVLIPSCFVATMLTALMCNWLGKELYNDPVFLQRVADGRCILKKPLPPDVQAKVDSYKKNLPQSDLEEKAIAVAITEPPSLYERGESGLSYAKTASTDVEEDIPIITDTYSFQAKASVWIFLLGILVVMVYSMIISDSIALFKPKVQRNEAIVCVMLLLAAIIAQFCKVPVHQIPLSSTFRAGINGCVCVMGVAWMGDTFVKSHMEGIKNVAGNVLRSQPWTLAVVMFVAGMLLYSQASTAKALMPIAFAIGVSDLTVVASFPAVSALFVLPTYPTLLAAIEMDDSGTTRLGKYVINHSFVVPGTVCIILAVALSFALGAAII